MAVEFSAGSLGSAALSLSISILEQLIVKGFITKTEALDMLNTLADAKAAKANLYQSEEEGEASALLETLRNRIQTKY